MGSKPTRVLHFSGGKDSLACLYLLQPDWDDITVMWCNTGAAHHSTIKMMEYISGIVPHFMEVQSDQPAYISEWGYPVDIVPVWRTGFGMSLDERWGRKFIDWTSCCATNIWAPLEKATRELGANVVYRGQKTADKIKSPIRSGHNENGVTYIFPLEEWTDEDVFAYLGDRVPPHYRSGERTSRDCVNCTAYLHENVERIAALPKNVRIELSVVLDDLRACMRESIEQIDSIIGR
jgi:3'-phosphoadenosine 5'-phosphosulfate sulfotransferase (PAPS reductase)/FAD synthetase